MAARRPGEVGFTLIELLVALAVMALGAGLAFPALERVALRRAGDDTQAVLLLALEQARADALRLDAPVAVSIGQGGQRLVFSAGQAPLDLPDGVRVAMPWRGVTFYPDRSSSGGTVSLLAGDMRSDVVVDPVSARIAEPGR